MGWSRGSYLAEEIWKEIKDFLPSDKKDKLAVKIYNAFCDMDADDWEFEEDNLFSAALKIQNPEEYAECKFLKELG